jgi:hypothetical protein
MAHIVRAKYALNGQFFCFIKSLPILTLNESMSILNDKEVHSANFSTQHSPSKPTGFISQLKAQSAYPISLVLPGVAPLGMP